MTTKLTIKKLADEMAKGVGGWTADRGLGYHDGSTAWETEQGSTKKIPSEWVRFTRDGITVVLNIARATDEWSRETAFMGLMVEGHTLFDGRCFTRFGVDTSSCSLSSRSKDHAYPHCYPDLLSLLTGEHARCVAARERSKTAVPVPGLPFSVQPEWFTKSAATLKTGRTVSLTQGGFGTGYTLSLVWRRGSKDADPALRMKLGVERLYVQTFDHD
jgi:hypothetical protein